MTSLKLRTAKLAKLWCDWNNRKITGNEAMGEIQKLFPRTIMWEWRKQVDAITTSNVTVGKES